jgi:hypothetical protein
MVRQPLPKAVWRELLPCLCRLVDFAANPNPCGFTLKGHIMPILIDKTSNSFGDIALTWKLGGATYTATYTEGSWPTYHDAERDALEHFGLVSHE